MQHVALIEHYTHVVTSTHILTHTCSHAYTHISASARLPTQYMNLHTTSVLTSSSFSYCQDMFKTHTASGHITPQYHTQRQGPRNDTPTLYNYHNTKPTLSNKLTRLSMYIDNKLSGTLNHIELYNT